MAVDMFLKLDGIDGESQDSQHASWIEVESFSWGVSNATVGSATGGAGSGKVSIQDLHVEKLFDKSSSPLAQKCVTGAHVGNGTLSMRKAGGSTDAAGNASLEFLKIKLTDVLVSSYQMAGANGGDRPNESLSLNFTKIEFDYTPENGTEIDTVILENIRQSP